VINADGSVPEMCGNGLRCVALHLCRERGSAGPLSIETDAGPRACVVESLADVAPVSVDMGAVRWLRDATIEVEGAPYEASLATAGNPHAIVLADGGAALAERLGPALQARRDLFPEGTNVEIVRPVDGVLDVAVWERGVGLTLACGTGACAAAAVACTKGLLAWDMPHRVRLPGGLLEITCRAADHHAIMRGPARRVFAGVLA
jgi:diaminopimelate epimerase